MHQNFNIQELVNELTQPNAVCIIENEVPENQEKRYLHIIYNLINTVKQCILKEVYNPYIHIKDVHGTFLFNDRLHIEKTSINQTAINNPGYCDIHLIKKKNSLRVYYCATTPQSLANNNRFYLDQINFANGVLDERAYKIGAISVLKMVKQGEGIDNNTPVDTSITVHNYEPETKQWGIEYYLRNDY